MADETVFDIPVAASGYSLAGKKIMVHDLSQPETTSTKLFDAGILLNTTDDETIIGNWQFKGDFSIDDTWSPTGMQIDKYWGATTIGDKGYGAGTSISVIDGHDADIKRVRVYADALEGYNLNPEPQDQEFTPSQGWSLNSNGTAILSCGKNTFWDDGEVDLYGDSSGQNPMFHIDGDGLRLNEVGNATIYSDNFAIKYDGSASLANGTVQIYEDGHIDIAEAIDLYPDGSASFAGNKFYVDLNGNITNGTNDSWSINSNGSAYFAHGGVNVNGRGTLSGYVVDDLTNRYLWSIKGNGETKLLSCLPTYTKYDSQGYIVEQTRGNESMFSLNEDGTFKLGMQISDGNPDNNTDNEDNIPHNYYYYPVLDYSYGSLKLLGRYTWQPNGTFELNSGNVGIYSDATNSVSQIGDYNNNNYGTQIIVNANENDNVIFQSNYIGSSINAWSIYDNGTANFSEINLNDEQGAFFTANRSNLSFKSPLEMRYTNSETNEDVWLHTIYNGNEYDGVYYEKHDAWGGLISMSGMAASYFFAYDPSDGKGANCSYTGVYGNDNDPSNSYKFGSGFGVYDAADITIDGTSIFSISKDGKTSIGRINETGFVRISNPNGGYTHIAAQDGGIEIKDEVSNQLLSLDYSNINTSGIGRTASFRDKDITVAGLEDLGTYKSGTVSLNTSHYIELKLADGNTYKVLVAN